MCIAKEIKRFDSKLHNRVERAFSSSLVLLLVVQCHERCASQDASGPKKGCPALQGGNATTACSAFSGLRTHHDAPDSGGL